MRYTNLIQSKGEKMIKTIPVRVSQSLAEMIKSFSAKYDISQQDAIRLAIQAGLKNLAEFIDAQKKGTQL